MIKFYCIFATCILIVYSCTNDTSSPQAGKDSVKSNAEKDISAGEEYITNKDSEEGSESKIAFEYHDGKPIKYVIVGDQVWTANNLSVTEYSKGDKIKNIKTEEDWKKAAKNETAAFAHPDYLKNSEKGLLYNWYAISDERGLCPSGWRIPTREDWERLIDHLGDQPGKKVKSTTEWMSHGETGPGTGTNESGLNVSPVGVIDDDGEYIYPKSATTFYTSKVRNDRQVEWIRASDMSVGLNVKLSSNNHGIGVSCRCILNDTDIDVLPKENKVLAPEISEEGNMIYAVFEGYEQQGIFYLEFKDENGKLWDFTNGDNQLGDFDFYSEELKGDKFKIWWKEKTSKMYAQDGETVIETKIPSITRIEKL